MRNVLLLLSGLLFFSCSKNNLAHKDYAKWIQDEKNGLKVSKKVGDFEFSLQYKTVEFLALLENPDGFSRPEQLNDYISGLKGYEYFTLTIKNKDENEIMSAGIENDVEYFSRLEYLMNTLQDDISMLTSNGDTIPCVLFHYERNYGISKLNNCVLAFESSNIKRESDRTLVYDDQILGTGKICLTIKGSDVQNVPALNLK
jgi:hypothetical protein